MSVKTFQHPKAMGNARKGLRALMFPMFFLSTQEGTVVTAYGEEDVQLGPTATLAALFAVGRLAPVPEETKLADERLRTRESYLLSWLPLDPAADYQSVIAAAQKYSPLKLTVPVATPVHLREGMTVYMAITTPQAIIPTNAPLIPLTVVQTYENVQAEQAEWTAIVVRDEASANILRGA